MNPAIWKLIRDYMSVSRGEGKSQQWMLDAMKEDQEGMEAAMQEGVPSDLEDSILSDLVALDQRELIIDNVGIYEKNDPVYVKIESERTKLIKQLEGEKGKRRGHSRYGRSGGGGFPRDILESKTAPRGLLGPKKRKY